MKIKLFFKYKYAKYLYYTVVNNNYFNNRISLKLQEKERISNIKNSAYDAEYLEISKSLKDKDEINQSRISFISNIKEQNEVEQKRIDREQYPINKDQKSIDEMNKEIKELN